jgi:hypothetical protein
VYTYESVDAYFRGDYAYSHAVGQLADESAARLFSCYEDVVVGGVTPTKGDTTATKIFGKTGALKLVDMRTRFGLLLKAGTVILKGKLKDAAKGNVSRCWTLN